MTVQDGLNEILRACPDKLVVSNPAKKAEPCRKITITKHRGYFLVEKCIGQRVEHEKHTGTDEVFLFPLLSGWLPHYYRQLDAWTDTAAYTMMIAKKGKVTLLSHKHNRTPETPHNHNKHYLLPEGTIIPPLVDLGVLTPDGTVVAAMRDKYRQINRFLEILADVLPEDAGNGLSIADYGCGKSYLTFITYYYLTAVRGVNPVLMTGLDAKPNVIDDCNAAARKYGYDGLQFKRCDITAQTEAAVFEKADVVLSLHACDTATDYALYHAVRGGARVILAAPCCQHELNAQMTDAPLPLLTRYGVVKERAAALMTDAIRANLLAACGYRTQLMEFVDLAHTPKNLLLRAVKTDIPPAVRAQYRAEVDAMCGMFGFKPALLRLLDNEQG